MKAVILAAGKGTRMWPLKRPKPLLKVAGKTILEHNLSSLSDVEEVIIILGHREQEMSSFIEKIKPNYNFKIITTTQKEQLGTYHALLQARPLLGNDFLVMCGDDLYSKQDIKACLAGLSVLAKEVDEPSRFGIVEQDGKGITITEKPPRPRSNLANTGLFHLDSRVFGRDVKKSKRGELELTDAVSGLDLKIIRASSWTPIGYTWNLLEANELFLQKSGRRIEGKAEKGSVLKEAIVLGKNSLVKSGAYIEGPVFIGDDCIIGPNCHIRPFTSIGNNCRIGNAVEIKNCVIGDNVSIGHLSYLGDSLVGDNANLGAGTIAANLRHDSKPIHVRVNGSLVNTRRRKFGCVIGDGVHTGIHTSIYPGRALSKDTLPGEIVREDK